MRTYFETADVVIEFSKPEATLQHLRQVVAADKAMIIATTGYDADELAAVQELASQIRCVMAPNMSLGVNVMIQALELIATALGDDYDIEVIEAHHNHKADSTQWYGTPISGNGCCGIRARFR